jgi:hypothetical protein
MQLSCAPSEAANGTLILFSSRDTSKPWLTNRLEAVDPVGRWSGSDLHAVERSNIDVLAAVGINVGEVVPHSTRHLMAQDSDSSSKRALAIKTFFSRTFNGRPVFGQHGVVTRDLDGFVTRVNIFNWRNDGIARTSEGRARASAEDFLRSLQVEGTVLDGWVSEAAGLIPATLVEWQSYARGEKSYRLQRIFLETGEVK